MNCEHTSISVKEGYLLCLDCDTEFRNGELGKLRKQKQDNCNHTKLDHGYASNPPKSKCLDCGKFFVTKELSIGRELS